MKSNNRNCDNCPFMEYEGEEHYWWKMCCHPGPHQCESIKTPKGEYAFPCPLEGKQRSC